jgi:glycosyltransferase involved in cell wall biosynthesis
MRKLLFFTEFYHPVQDTTGYYLTKIIHTAARCVDVPIRVCCAAPSNNGELHVSKNLTVKRVKPGKYNKNKLMQRITKYVVITLRFTAYAVTSIRRNDLVFAVTNPAFFILCLAFLKKIRPFRYTLLVYDVFPENLVPAGLAQQDSLIHRAAVRCFNWAYREADELIVIGRDMEEVVRRKVGNGCRITRIPNWADVDAIQPQPKAENELMREHKLLDKTVFLFAGNLGRVQGIENLLRAIAKTRSESAAFLFAGDGALRPEIETFIRENPDKKVVHLGRFPLSSQQLFLNACDVALVTLEDAMYGLGVPSKSYFSMAAGKPLLLVADQDSEIGRVITETNIGWIVPPNQPEMLAGKIDEICQLGDLDKTGRRARAVVERDFSEQVVLSRYAHYFRELSGQPVSKAQRTLTHVAPLEPAGQVGRR